jgi:hypothetical protein
MRKVVLVFISLFCIQAFAEASKETSENTLAEVAPTTIAANKSTPHRSRTAFKARSILRKNFYQLQIGYHLWHEAIEVTSGGTPGNLSAQFHGFNIGGSFQRPFKDIHWVEYYGAHVSFGSIKGTGEGTITDALKDQPWYGLTLSPGIIYRATAVSEIGFILPLVYRNISWKLDPTAQLETHAKNFSVGLGAQFISRFTPYSSVMASLTHQHMWKTTVWGIAWQYDFK